MRRPWAQPLPQILAEFSVSADTGLTSKEAEKRLIQYGLNSLKMRKRAGPWSLLWKQLKNPVIYVLAFCAIVIFFLNEHLEALAIVIIIFINVIIAFIQESKSDAAIEALASISSPRAKVLRDGTLASIPSEEIIPGDVLVLEAGDYVPADARLVSAHQLYLDESILTGESLPKEKKSCDQGPGSELGERKNMIFAGTAVSRGTAKAIVIETGKDTEIGKIAEMMALHKSPETPLQLRLKIVSQKLLSLGIIIILIVIAIGIIQERPWLEIVMSAISLAIAAVPEGLPTVVTVALVMAIHRMSKKKALIRKIDSVETLGATDVICTDKTGTLTTGKMSVRETYLLNEDQRDLYFMSLILCNNASTGENKVGDTTEIALLDYAVKNDFNVDHLRKKYPRLYEWSFDSNRKRMSVVVQLDDKPIMLCKGAPESILPLCDIGQPEAAVLKAVTKLSEKGMRVLACAWKEVRHDFNQEKANEAETNLRFLGLVAMADAPRKESMDAIKRCQEADIRIIMITGDHPKTAAAIAFELGITKNSDADVCTGSDLDIMPEEELDRITDRISAFARVSPAHKLKLITALQRKGHVVAMTGDGVNDAPALKLADIGVAMGKGGTEVARQASSMILTDDNFATIVDAVEEGRAVNGNIKRTLQYLLSHNLAELLFILTSTISGLPIPLLPVSLLWLNLVTDSFPSVSLAGEKVPSRYLKESKGPSPKSFFEKSFYEELIFVAAIITLLNVLIYKYALNHYDLKTARSIVFSFMVYVGLLRSFSCRSDTKTFFEMKPNLYHLLSVIVPIGLQISLQNFDVTKDIFSINALSLKTNCLLLLIACVPVTFIESMKLWKRIYRQH